jgi:hypothetical protein
MTNLKNIIFIFLFFFFSVATVAQTIPQAILKGTIREENNKPLEFATVAILGTSKGTTTDSKGNFSLQVPANQALTVVIKHLSYKEERKIIKLKANETYLLNVQISEKVASLDSVEITNKDEQRNEISVITINPLKIKQIPSPFGDAMDIVKVIGLGVVTNSELTSAYSVRGGSFDENLVYVNNMEVYRPFLVSNGQQEGLSFPNPDLIKEIKFSAGGWQAKYGDKLSSVLNIEYKTPNKFAASASGSLLGYTAHIEGITKNQRLSFLAGVRHKSARYLFNTFDTQGSYLPKFTDIQGMFTYKISKKMAIHKPNEAKTTLTTLFNYAQNRYQVIPQSRRSEFGTFFNALTLFVAFDGQENMNYDTWQSSMRLTHHFSKKLTTNLIISAVDTQEREYTNTEGAYRLSDINTNVGKDSGNDREGTIRGQGRIFDYRRNALNATILSAESRNEFRQNINNSLEFGAKYVSEVINDKLNEYNFTDSADYTTINNRINTQNNLSSNRFSGYVQQSHILQNHTLTYGFRLNYWDFNQQLLFSPRLQYAIKPNWKKDIVFNIALGYYQQAPFYRELRNYQGVINPNLKAQTSIHWINGMSWDFNYWGRPFRLISEFYYKYLTDVIPYDVDNVRLRYYAVNSAEAFTTGIDTRLSGEFIKGTDSWIGISLMTAQEKVAGDSRGFIRRPVDQRMTVTLNFEDHLPKNPTVRLNMRMLYGTGLPFGVPNQPDQRAVLSGQVYWRVDIGFSKIIYIKGNKDRSVWLALEVLNLLANNNVISYLWIKDYADNSYAIPNGLSQRFLNLRAVFRFTK